MSVPLVIYDTNSGELRNNPEAFAERGDYVASFVWIKNEGENVEPGAVLATIQWGTGSNETLYAPGGCNGMVINLNRNIMFENLEYTPSQFLARIS